MKSPDFSRLLKKYPSDLKTLTLGQLVEQLGKLALEHGDVPVVLWDLDTGQYFRLMPDNLETQQMPDGSTRVSIGVNDFLDQHEPEPVRRNPPK